MGGVGAVELWSDVVLIFDVVQNLILSHPMLYPLATVYETNVHGPLNLILSPNWPVRLYNIGDNGELRSQHYIII